MGSGTSSALQVIILAAGQGTRMRSALPKVLHKLGGKSLLAHVVDSALQLSPRQIYVVCGYGGDQLAAAATDLPVKWIRQEPQLGTGHAVAQVLPHLANEGQVLILYGDVPLIEPATLRALTSKTEVALLTTKLDNPAGYGRIVRNELGQVQAIVEHKDATTEQRQITEINTGIMAVSAASLARWVGQLGNNNAQGEYYLTDIVRSAVAEGFAVHTASPSDFHETLGINDRLQLAELERFYQLQRARELMRSGVTLRDPARFDLRGELEAASDVEIDINVIIEGKVKLGPRVKIGPNCYLKDVTVGADSEIRANSILEGKVVLGDKCIVGPFARIRPNTELKSQTWVGNFVEIKHSTIAEGSKISHLSYIGDSTLGKEVNIGAGTITCNYDGCNKHPTVIEDGAFIGSNTALVAPVVIGEGATIGAGSVIRQNAPAGELTLSRPVQSTIKGWQRPSKKI